MSTLPNPDPVRDADQPLDNDAIEMIGTLLAIAARMMIRVGGIAHLLAAVLVMIIGLIVTHLPRGLQLWPASARIPSAHRRWLVATPARWAAP